MSTPVSRIPESQPSDVPTDAQRRPRRRRLPMQKILIVVLSLIALVGVYYFIQYQRLSADPSIEARAEAERVVRELSRVMEVPHGELPIIATVSDKEQLAGQAFFARAENGDQVVIFPTSMKAVLYRPSTRKVVDMAPLSGPAPTPQASVPTVSTPAPAPTPEPQTESSITIE